jgi:HEAT repeat protein
MALEDADEDVREAAVDALASIGGETAIGLLEQALADEDESVRETAADILAELTAAKDRGAALDPQTGKSNKYRQVISH